MIGSSMQEKFYPCLTDEPVIFSLQTACNEILKNVFTTERGFEHEESRHDDDDDDDYDDNISCSSIATDSTRKIRNATSSSSSSSSSPKQVMESTMRKFQDLVRSASDDRRSLMFTAESAAELQYRCNQRAQRIQRAYERGLKKLSSSEEKEDHYARHLHERYGNRASPTSTT